MNFRFQHNNKTILSMYGNQEENFSFDYDGLSLFSVYKLN